MRVAVVADVHANLTALLAVARDLESQAPDLVVCGGDLVGGGSRPAEVIDLVRAAGWPTIIGNTDEVLWKPEPLEAIAARLPSMKATWDLLFADVERTRDESGMERLDWLRRRGDRWTSGATTVVHASPGDCWNAPSATASDEELEVVFGGLGRLVVHGHTHVPFIRGLPRLTLANAGSVGQPYDGDPRASYLLVTADVPEIRRVAYDVEGEIVALQKANGPLAGWLARNLRTGRYAPATPR